MDTNAEKLILTKFNIITDKVTQCFVLYLDTINTVNIRGVSDVGFPIFADTDADLAFYYPRISDADANITYFIILGL